MNDTSKVAIGIAYHKQCDFHKEAPYIPIQVGAAIHEDLHIQKDSDGDNISFMNAYCSELSATYWIWKNCKAHYKGLFHYRRFMTFKKDSILKRFPTFCLYYLSKCAAPFIRDARCFYPEYSIISIKEEESQIYLKQFSIDLEKDIETEKNECYTLGYMKHSTRTMRTHLNLGIGGKHFEILEPIIKSKFPNFYPYFLQTMRSGKLIGYNMIIAKNDIFNQYGEIMFGILNEYHHYFIQNLSENQTNKALLRDSGYVGEIITDAFIRMIKTHGRKCKKLNCAFIDITPTGLSYKKESTFERIKNMLGI